MGRCEICGKLILFLLPVHVCLPCAKCGLNLSYPMVPEKNTQGEWICDWCAKN